MLNTVGITRTLLDNNIELKVSLEYQKLSGRAAEIHIREVANSRGRMTRYELKWRSRSRSPPKDPKRGRYGGHDYNRWRR